MFRPACIAIIAFLSVDASAAVLTRPTNVAIKGQVTAAVAGYGGGAEAEIDDSETYARCHGLGISETGYGGCEARTQLDVNGLLFQNATAAQGWRGDLVATNATTKLRISFTNPACAETPACQSVRAIQSLILPAKMGFYAGEDPYYYNELLPDGEPGGSYGLNIYTADNAPSWGPGWGIAGFNFRVGRASGSDEVTVFERKASLGMTINKRRCYYFEATYNDCLIDQAADPDNSFSDDLEETSGFLKNVRKDTANNRYGYQWDESPLTIVFDRPIEPGESATIVYEIETYSANNGDCSNSDEGYPYDSCMVSYSTFGDPLIKNKPQIGIVVSGMPAMSAFSDVGDSGLNLDAAFLRPLIIDGVFVVGGADTVPAPATAGLVAVGLGGIALRRRR